jgi:hypothetical protein
VGKGRHMRSALYYPHTTVTNEHLVKTALLLWDRLEYIVPWPHFRSHHGSRGIAKAMELIGKPRCPGDDEKQEAHARLKEVVSRKFPPQFYFGRRRGLHFEEHYEMYPEKLSPDSWDLLGKARLSGKLLPNSDYPLSEFGGLMVMSILADCCAGTTRSRVTDRGSAYATLAGFLGNDPAGPKIRKADAHGQLVPISLKVIDTSQVGIDALIQLREREEKEAGHTLRDLRHRYVDGLETYVSRLVNEKATKADAAEIQRQFANDMKADLKDLRDELGFARKDALLSKEFFATVLTATGTVASWLFGVPLQLEGVITAAGAPVAIGGLMGVHNKYLRERQAVMKKHPMAYLYEAKAQIVR